MILKLLGKLQLLRLDAMSIMRTIPEVRCPNKSSYENVAGVIKVITFISSFLVVKVRVIP